MKQYSRLTNTLTPINYRIHIKLNKDLNSFETDSVLTATINQPSSTIELHCKNLDIEELSVSIGDEKLALAGYKLDKERQVVVINLTNKLDADTEISIKSVVSADISSTMHGIYPATYTENDQDKKIISTQFESHHAREVFPCVDEPAAKATFDFKLTTVDTHTALSNTPVKSHSKTNGLQTVEFEATPKMSTYLLAFASGDFSSVESTTKNDVKVRIFATNHHEDKLQFALDVATRCLEFYEDYFGVEYPLDKCDHIAIPEFASGAMENWGCITYRETALLVDTENSSITSKQWAALVIAHELAHMWFGNLVTMEWWDDLWLNEGFASWIEFKAVDSIFPEWNMWEQFVSTDYAAALSMDALQSSHPIRVDINDPREINEIFDTITYRKGPSIIRMLNDYLGDNEFRLGLQSYISKHAYGNAITEDLWAALSKQTGKDVGSFMDTWTTKTGYPIISLEQDDDSYYLTQERFAVHPDVKDVDYVWQVPLFDGSNNVLSEKTKSFKLKDSILNSGRSGLYRVAYTHELMNKFAKNIENNEITAIDRLGLLSDAFDTSEAGQSSTTDALDLLSGFINEKDANVLSEMASDINSVAAIMFESHEAAESAMKHFVHSLIKQSYQELGWSERSSDSSDQRLARETVLGLAVKFDYADARKEAEKMFEQYQNGSPLNPNFRNFIYGHMVREHGNNELYEWFKARHNDEKLQEEITRLARALNRFEGEDFAKRNLEMMQSEDVRQQDVISWLARLLANRTTRIYVWQWYRTNWQWIYDLFKDGHLLSYLAMVLAPLTTFEQAEEIRAFFKDKDTTGLDMSLAQSLERIESVAYWRERDVKQVQDYFKQ